MRFTKAMRVVTEFFMFGLTYGGTIFIIWTYLKVFDKELTKFITLLTLSIMGFIFLLMIIFEFTVDQGYSVFYTFLVSYIALGLHLIVFCGIFQLIKLCAKKIKKWISLIIILVIPVGYCIYGFIIPRIIKIEKKELYYEGYTEGPTTIAHLTDVHLGAVYQKPFVNTIIKKLKKNSPDIVVITGDFFDASLNVKLDWLKPFNELNIPILLALGNHDETYGRNKILELVEQTNIEYINKKIVKKRGINFFGIDYEEDLTESLNGLKDSLSATTGPNILLLHVPKKPKNLKDYKIFLALSGHTHDGQIFPSNIFQYIAFECWNGLYEYKEGGTYTYVSSGVGDTFFPFRTFTRSKIAFITIKGK